MSGYRQRPGVAERRWTPVAVEQHLRLAGEVQPHQRVRVKRFRARTVRRVWLTLELRSGESRFERNLQIADAPSTVRTALEQPCAAPVTARHVTTAELPRPLRDTVERFAAEQRELGYQVDATDLRYAEESVLEVRYRVGGEPWTDVWLSAGEPLALGYGVWKRSWSLDPSEVGAVALSAVLIGTCAFGFIVLAALLVPLFRL